MPVLGQLIRFERWFPSTAFGGPSPRSGEEKGAQVWQRHLVALCLSAVALLLLFRREIAELATIWWNSSTFNHCLLIVPIIGWLVWQRLPELRRLRPAAWAPGLLLVAAGGGAWLLGEAGGLAIARHAGLLLMLEGLVVALLGRAVALGLAFPLFYAWFLLPIGEELVPAMQTVTARISMVLLGLVGVPAHLEGIFVTIPTGYFEVAEACAGVKFLVAMVALGALVGNVCFRSWRRRIAFMAVSVAVPILANGIRAWGTIYIAHLTSTDFAADFDHVVYGGIFFAIVIALILGLGWRFFDRGVGEPWFDPEALSQGRRVPIVPTVAAALALAALPVAWSSAIAATGTQPVAADFALPEVPGWQRVAPGADWRPTYAGADLFRMARYRDARGREVDLAVAAYARQGEGGELIRIGQGAAPSGSGWAWTAAAAAPLNGRAERIASHGVVREVVSFYRVGDIVTGSGLGVKLETMRRRLLGGPQRAVAVLVSARAPAAGLSPRPAIDDFLTALGPVDALADRAAGPRL
ncbi:exosortase A [Sphingosinicella terrae]|uniref:exosortase A n=1 Tax=Sphingosinicella terrae TaxID=2172047 RepID=UPI000E0D0C05|nr:exosortase A [Sphingosinicella terrae]